MILLLHILIALSSVAYTVYAFFSPTKLKLKKTYGLISLTIISGTYLVLTTPTNLTQTCVTGLVYVAVMLVGTAAVRAKLNALNPAIEISENIRE